MNVRQLAVVVTVLGTLAGSAAAGPVAAAPVVAAATYANPVAAGLAVNPTILRSGSTYYAYLSGFDFYLPFPVMALSSPDLVTWTQVGNVLPPQQAGGWLDASSGWRFSSPSVRHIPGNPASSRYVLYFTGTEKGTGRRCIGVATAASPAGPFTGSAAPLICPDGGAQDPSIVPLPDGVGIQELVYVKGGAGAGIYNQVLPADGLATTGTPFLLYRANPTWWHRGVVERPTVSITPSGQIYLFFSGGPANTAARAIGWTTCTQGFGVVNDCSRQTRFGTWIAGTGQVDSPSGPQVFTDGTYQWLVYDGLAGGSCPAGGACTGTRTMRIDKLCFTGKGPGGPRTNAPSTGAQGLSRSGNCSVDVPGAAFGIVPGSVVDDGTVVSEPAKVGFRDGGSTAPIAGRMLWAFSDTLIGGGCTSLTNTAALGAPAAGATGPSWTTEPVDGNGCPSQFIGYTAEELAFNRAPEHAPCPPAGQPQPPECGWRMALWETGLMPLPNGDVLAFFLKLIDKRCWACYEFLGIGAVRVPAAGVAAGIPTANRSATVSPRACNPTCLFDISGGDRAWFRPLVDDGFVYLYDTAKVARAAIADVQNRSAWRFWTGSGWSADQSAAVDVPGLFDGGWDSGAGQVAYSPYLDRYLNVVADNWPETYKLVVQTAPAPWGPFTAEVLVHDASVHRCVENGDPYGALQAPELVTDGGRTVPITYARPGRNFGTDPECPGQVRYVTFRLR